VGVGDNEIQAPDYSQSFNRYSYAWNNPLKFTDPSGEVVWFVPVIAGAVVGAYAGASIQSGTAAFWNWKPDAWKGAIAGAIVGATVGYGISGAIGASGMKTACATAVSKSAGTVSTMVNSGTVNIVKNAILGGGWDGAWKAGIAGLATGGWNSTGGFGMVKGFGAKSDIGLLAGKMGFQMIGNAASSIGNNWARGENLFSKVSLGVGPVNLTLGKDQKLLQWQNNIGNILTNGAGLANLAFGGNISFDWKNLSLNYKGGLVDRYYNTNIGEYGAFGAHSVIGSSNLFTQSGLYQHELHHLWQSRGFGDMFIFNYIGQGIGAMLMGGSPLGDYNFFEAQAYGGFWW
jgi:hypothetical protein